jgi:hypothetical protein
VTVWAHGHRVSRGVSPGVDFGVCSRDLVANLSFTVTRNRQTGKTCENYKAFSSACPPKRLRISFASFLFCHFCCIMNSFCLHSAAKRSVYRLILTSLTIRETITHTHTNPPRAPFPKGTSYSILPNRFPVVSCKQSNSC